MFAGEDVIHTSRAARDTPALSHRSNGADLAIPAVPMLSPIFSIVPSSTGAQATGRYPLLELPSSIWHSNVEGPEPALILLQHAAAVLREYGPQVSPIDEATATLTVTAAASTDAGDEPDSTVPIAA